MQCIVQILQQPSLVSYILGANNYAWVHFADGRKRLVSRPVAYFEEQLPGLIRIHKTALVNLVFVRAVHRPGRLKTPGLVCMSDGAELPISRRRWTQIQQLLPLGEGRGQQGAEIASQQGGSPPEPRHTGAQPSLPPLIVAVMTEPAWELTQKLLWTANLPYQAQQVKMGAELTASLLLEPGRQRPALVLIDARTNRPDRILTLKYLKAEAQLRAIPVVWLARPGEDIMVAYELGANSVVVVPDNPLMFDGILEQVFLYWLAMAQLPQPEELPEMEELPALLK